MSPPTCFLDPVDLGLAEAIDLHQLALGRVRDRLDDMERRLLQLLDVGRRDAELLNVTPSGMLEPCVGIQPATAAPHPHWHRSWNIHFERSQTEAGMNLHREPHWTSLDNTHCKALHGLVHCLHKAFLLLASGLRLLLGWPSGRLHCGLCLGGCGLGITSGAVVLTAAQSAALAGSGSAAKLVNAGCPSRLTDLATARGHQRPRDHRYEEELTCSRMSQCNGTKVAI